MLECVLKTLACWGLRVGPSKILMILLLTCQNKNIASGLKCEVRERESVREREIAEEREGGSKMISNRLEFF